MDAYHPARTLLTLLVLILVLGSVPSESPGQEPTWDPRAWSRYDGWEVTGFTVTGVPPTLVRDLEAGLAVRGRWKILTGRRRPPFKASALLDDLRRTRLMLARSGYPGSRAVPVLTPDTAARTVDVRLEVDPGPAVRVGSVDYGGWPEGVDHPAADAERLMAVGDVFIDEAFADMQVFLKQWLHTRGYALAEIEATIRLEAPDRIGLTVTVDSGVSYIIGNIDIEGCSADLIPLAERVLNIPAGAGFDATRLDEAGADLRATQLFRAVELGTEPVGPGELDLTVALANARMRSWRASVGTWNDNPWMVASGWTHRNLLQRGRGLDLSGTYATHEQRLGAVVFWLGWLSPRARTSVGTEWLREDEDAYRSEEYRVELVQSFRPRNRALSNVGVGLSNVDVQNFSPDLTDVPESQDWLLEFWFDRKWDWTDDMMFPSRGGYTKIGLTYAPPGGPFNSAYGKIQADGAAYVPLISRLILAGRLRVGWSRPLGESEDLLANRRYYAGGYNTMRGFERRRLGPVDSADNPRGGQAVFLAGAETRVRLFGIFDMAFFADSGQVWRHPGDARVDDLELAVGVDLDLRSPLGPVRVGHAWNVTPVSAGDPRTLWHFGIGYPW